MKIDILLGLQWGDEGKGKIVDALSPGYDVVARFQGGPNAGHSLEIKNVKTELLKDIPIDGVFIFVGQKPQTEFLKDTLELNENGFVK